jgi:nifR3 family TIM-barrel protein
VHGDGDPPPEPARDPAVAAWRPRPAPERFLAALAQGRAVLAPMAGYTDAPFRRLARAYGAAWAVTEMVSARSLALGDARGLAISAPHEGETDVVVQVFAADPDEAATAVARLHAAYAPAAFDLNMGCPVKKVLHRGCGAELIRDPQRAAAIVRAIAATVPVPVTAKTRLGLDRVEAHEVAHAVVEAGAAILAVHGRTAAQRYAGRADWAAIAALAATLPVPVLGSGDVADASGMAAARAAGVGAMIARGALGRPWVFRTVRGGPPPSRAEVVGVAWRHARDHVAWYGGEHALPRLRGQLAAYAVAALGADAGSGPIDPRRGRDAAGLRDALMRATRLVEVADALREATGVDPLREDLDPLPGPSPRPPAWTGWRGRRPRRSPVAERRWPAPTIG